MSTFSALAEEGSRRRSSRYFVKTTDLARIADMEVRSKISRDARRAVMAKAEGLPSWKPAAPGSGMKPVEGQEGSKAGEEEAAIGW